MLPGKADYEAYKRGDTINTRTITLTDENNLPISLAGAQVYSTFSSPSNPTDITKAIGTGITVTDEANGVFQIDQFKITIAGLYDYEVSIVFPGDVERTYLTGQILIVEDVDKQGG